VVNARQRCSSGALLGAGRTGTFIALDILMEQATTTGVVDVLACVHELRRQRMDMVQKEVFIITQSPLPATVEDFWSLVYDYNCSVIVTLDNIDGKTEVSCFRELIAG
jgi:protein tyrosine phosphatase